MRRLTATGITFTLASLLAFLLATCDQAGKRVTIRYKFQPETRMFYEQISRGLIKVQDLTTDVLTLEETAENRMDIEYYVRRLLEDSTSEIIESKTISSRYEICTDSNPTDSVKEKTREIAQLVKYMKPNGSLVDIEFASDTARGNLEYLKQYYKQGFPVFPDGNIGQGHSWSQSTTVGLPDGPMEATTTYTVKSFARERGYDCVIIEYDGFSIIPLSVYDKDEYTMVSGLDSIQSTGHMYFAYKEGIPVLIKERWVLDSDRTIVRKMPDTTYGYQPGDTVLVNVAIEYDVDYYLTDLQIP